LDSWLLPKDPNLIPDIYFIGFEEVIELNTTNIIMVNEEKKQQILDEWDKKINESIQKRGKYVKLVDMNLVGINLYFYILENKSEKVKNITKKLVKTGLKGATGNKGSCCINFDYENTSFSIACSHLAAGNKNKQRLKELDYILNLKLNTFYNSDMYEEKLKNLDIINQNLEDVMPSEEDNKINTTNTQRFPSDDANINFNTNDDSTLFKDSDIWIFFGDLNFRVDMDYEEFSQYLKKGSSWNNLLDYDQFNKFKLASIDSMEYIQEDEIKFPPTYKYIIDSNEYDYTPENVGSFNQNNENLKKSGKRRNPSWCDRIFYKKNAYVFKDGRKMINGLEYNNVMNENFQSSDHRPIYHIFDAIIFKENEEKKSKIERELISNENMGISNKYMKRKDYDY
jgi:phosphatidylinositol-bisphosphatase